MHGERKRLPYLLDFRFGLFHIPRGDFACLEALKDLLTSCHKLILVPSCFSDVRPARAAFSPVP